MLHKHIPAEVQVLPMHRFELEHADLLMRSMPTLAQSSRDLVGRYVHRLLTLAVYPVKVLPVNPIPKGWLPKSGPRKALAYLYPSEDAAR